MEFNFNRALFFALQRLDSPGLRLKPEQVAQDKDRTGFTAALQTCGTRLAIVTK